ncbi:protein tantalus [Drosophila grimshawi]|uniref:GH15029 n=1 Tax=Drosophila grimshawi TaxID=7222 RepID=B4IZZ4_DROGR|nr:protein tantalus [Drosophila grimshawi]EDV96766.1 GH15029 [Drosophila grimshawi]
MENIVHKFATISFQPKEVVLTENRAASTFSAAGKFTWNLKPMTANASATTSTSMSNEMLDSDSADSIQSDGIESQQSRGEDNDESDSHSSSNSSSNYRIGRRGGVSRRRMPARVSKDNFNRMSSAIARTEVKKRRKELKTNEQMLKSIEKLYTSKRMKKFTPANLETIFEEPSDENAADAEDDSEECAISSQVRVVKFGSRKLRRAISFNDGLNKNKNLIKKRRLKVKKTFGKRFAVKKISMMEFHDRLNKSLDSAMCEGDEDATDADVAESSLVTPKPIGIAFTDDMQMLQMLPQQSAAFE